MSDDNAVPPAPQPPADSNPPVPPPPAPAPPPPPAPSSLGAPLPPPPGAPAPPPPPGAPVPPPPPAPGYGYPASPGYAPSGYAAPRPAKPRANGFATTSLIVGVLGITVGLCVWFFPVLPILAVVFGHVALGQIRRQGTSGRGLAIAGLVTGYIGLAVTVVLIILVVIGNVASPTPTF